MTLNRMLSPQAQRALVAGCLLFSQLAAGDEIDLSDVPLLLLQGVPPNLILTLDDSSIMGLAYLPDSVSTAGINSLRVKSSRLNRIHYDPTVTYSPPLGADGLPLSAGAFNNACLDAFEYAGVDCLATCTMDLSTEYRAPYNESGSGFCATQVTTDGRRVPRNEFGRDPLIPESCDWAVVPPGTDCASSAFYYRYEDACGNADNDACYSRVDVGSAADIGAGGFADAAEARENFANWFAYYRNRWLAVKSATSLMAADIPEDTRVGYQVLNSVLVPRGVLHEVRAFDSAQREAFYTWLLGTQKPLGGDTPLILSAIRVGEYLRQQSPYLEDPSLPLNAETNPLHECRRNYHILYTAGAWTDAIKTYASWGFLPAMPEAASQNHDGLAYAPADYDPTNPFEDDNVGGLADVAFYYWSRDLLGGNEAPNTLLPVVRERRDLDGDGTVSQDEIWRNSRNNPATWQHMVTYTVGLGVDGNIPYQGDPFPDQIFEDAKVWSGDETFDMVNRGDFDPMPSEEARIDDLWHAAVNGRGIYFSARDASSLTEAFLEILNDVGAAQQRGSAASATVTAGSLSPGSKVFQVSFDSADWSGEIIARLISLGITDPDHPDYVASCANVDRAEVCPGFAWNAADLLDAMDPISDRKIVTYRTDTGAGAQFTWDGMSNDQKEAMLDGVALGEADADQIAEAQARVAYLRGSDAEEQRNGGELRDRPTTILGDIVNSAPLFVGPPNRLYAFDAYRGEGGFVAVNANRPGMVYVGANDGMLHAFDADTGVERFAYVPELVFDKLAGLAEADFIHQFLVDGQLNEGDVLINGSWSTILVGALGKGGQGLFSLDITNPSPANQAAAAAIPLWEFSGETHPDVGFIYGKPGIARIADGEGTKWVVITGNGYNNTSQAGEDLAACADGAPEDAVCTISETGNAVLYVLDAADGSIVSDGAIDTGVGMAQDPEGDQRPNGLGEPTVVDANGDLIADFAYAADIFGNVWKFNLRNLASAPRRLFTAEDADGNNQPITTPVEVMRHPTGLGVLVLFGTGRFLGVSDIDDDRTQTYYGIWDDGSVADNNYDPPSRGDLLEQEFIGDVQTKANEGGQTVSLARVSTDRPIDWSQDQDEGWYIDLQGGERVVSASNVAAGRLIFVTLIPSGDPCVAGGSSWANALDAKDGSRLNLSPFDYDLDGTFGGADLFTVNVGGQDIQVAGSSIRLKEAEQSVYSSPASVVLEGGTTISYIATSEGELIDLRESSVLEWRVWQQLR